MLYTGKGDTGETGTFGSSKRVSKASCQTEALGALDEFNSFLGLAKLESTEWGHTLADDGPFFRSIVHDIQKNLFIVQAEVAGTPMSIPADKVRAAEALIERIEKELPPIHSFFISGGTKLAALFDVCRTLARKAERRVVAAVEEGTVKAGEHTLAYLNRLSSLLYALARLSNHKAGIKEQAPDYK